MIGLKKEEIVDNICHKYICPSELNNCPITDLHQEIDNTERILINKDGNEIPILKTVSKGVYNKKEYLLESFLDISNQKQLEALLEHQSQFDSLTEVGNRRSLFNQLEKEIRNSIRTKESLSILMIDIDYFKKYNDKYGHVKGDECLKKVAESIKTCIHRPCDHVYRYGGEEFIIMLPDTNIDGCLHVAQRIRGYINTLKIEHLASDINIYLTVSIGGYVYEEENMFTVQDIIDLVDNRLYKAKEKGRDCIVIA